MQNFKDLLVWQKAHELTLKIYAVTSNFPVTEQYGLVSQMRRSSSSIPTNIVEGCGRNGNKEFAHFLNISLGSANELEYQLILSNDLSYINENDWISMNTQITEIKKMLYALLKKVKQ